MLARTAKIACTHMRKHTQQFDRHQEYPWILRADACPLDGSGPTAGVAWPGLSVLVRLTRSKGGCAGAGQASNTPKHRVW